jgi:hypothetical protein
MVFWQENGSLTTGPGFPADSTTWFILKIPHLDFFPYFIMYLIDFSMITHVDIIWCLFGTKKQLEVAGNTSKQTES